MLGVARPSTSTRLMPMFAITSLRFVLEDGLWALTCASFVYF